MPLNLPQVEQELAACPLVSPYSVGLATAVVSDVFRKAGRAPPSTSDWVSLRAKFQLRMDEQLGMLAHFLVSSSLLAASIEGLTAASRKPAEVTADFLAQIEPLTAEMIRANAFRREELLRKWITCLGGGVAGESSEESARRLQALDYRTTLAEYTKAEVSRKKEADGRARLLREAQEREAAARGWRE